MRSRQRNITVFSISALDLFAAALAAFILIVLVLFPYYRLGGTDVSMEELEDLVKKRREAAETMQTDMAQIRALRAEIRLLDKQYKSTEDNMSEVEAKLQEVLKQTVEIVIPDPQPLPDPEPVPDPVPDPIPEPPRSVNTGVEFSILGLGTNEKNVAIVVDMSGSMNRHKSNVVNALNEILDMMTPDHKFVIIGYRGGPSYSTYPSGGRQAAADAAMMQGARRFVDRLPNDFGGGTPTQHAMLRTLNLRPGAIILISDGEPTDGGARQIVANVTRQNHGRAEIHTVAIGNYTKNQQLTRFLQEMARNNNGDFVGRAR